MSPVLFLSLLAVYSGVAADSPESKAVPADVADAVRQYPKFAKMLPEPKSVGAQFANLCGRSTEAQELSEKIGPHFGAHVQYYRNPVALVPDAATEGKLARNVGPWPVGSIFVKEKFRKEWTKENRAHMRLTGIAGMIKRTTGTKPESGDWEFFWVSGGKITTTGLQSCAGCHSGAARDYVFTSFPPAEKAKEFGR